MYRMKRTMKNKCLNVQLSFASYKKGQIYTLIFNYCS